MPPVIRIENLSKSYRIQHGAARSEYRTLRETLTGLAAAPFRRFRGQSNGRVEEFWALKDVNLEVQQGEVVGIIGRNGAGKSTLLKILSRITAPTTGRIELHGRVGSLLEVGTGFHPELTGRENVYLNGSILGMTRREIQRKFDEIVDFSGVEKFLDTPVKRYSSGMYVRLAFAVAAHLEPEILIVDEVLAVGDAEFQKKCLGKMQNVAAGGRTVLFVSHNMPAVSTLCSRAILLQSGNVRANGSPECLIAQYLTPSESITEASLANRTDRIGDGCVRFLSCKVSRTLHGPAADAVDSHNDIFIEFTVGANDRRPVWLAVAIHDGFNQRIVGFPMRNRGLPARSIDGETTFVLHVPRLPLLEGKYRVHLRAFHAWASSEPCDVIEDAARFSVNPTDIYRSGLPWGAFWGMLHVAHTWFDTTQTVDDQCEGKSYVVEGN